MTVEQGTEGYRNNRERWRLHEAVCSRRLKAKDNGRHGVHVMLNYHNVCKMWSWINYLWIWSIQNFIVKAGAVWEGAVYAWSGYVSVCGWCVFAIPRL